LLADKVGLIRFPSGASHLLFHLCTIGSSELNHVREEPFGYKMKSRRLESCPETNLPLVTAVQTTK